MVVLEGRDRIGGRVSVHTTWDKPFDTGMFVHLYLDLNSGANFIHGTTLNPLMPLVEASDARLTFPDDTTPTVYGTLGKRLSPQTAQLAYDRVWKYSQEAIGYSSLEGPISPELSVNEFCLARLYADDALTNKVKTITKHLFHLLSDFTGTDAEKQSLRHYKVEATLPVQLTAISLMKGGISFSCLDLRSYPHSTCESSQKREHHSAISSC